MESHFPIPDRKKLREKSYRGKCGPMLLISNVERGPVKRLTLFTVEYSKILLAGLSDTGPFDANA